MCDDREQVAIDLVGLLLGSGMNGRIRRPWSRSPCPRQAKRSLSTPLKIRFV